MADEEPHALLTRGQRKYLKGDKSGYSRQQQKEYRDGIPERVKRGLLDFSILVDELSDDQYEEIFGFGRDQADREVRDAMQDALRVLYTGAERYAPDASFKRLVESAAYLAENESDARRFPDPTFEMDYQIGGDVSEAVIEKLENRQFDELTVGELYSFLQLYSESEPFDPNDALEYSRQKYGTSEYAPGDYEPDYGE